MMATDDYHELDLDGRSTGGILATNDTDIELTLSAWILPAKQLLQKVLCLGGILKQIARPICFYNIIVYTYMDIGNFSTNMTQKRMESCNVNKKRKH